ncbi:gliding motility protein GldN [Duncaniella freteri]|jgi:gliding motility associated protien GldN|uniref:type IX secretion system ring protein PorN/GldN n=1 Tax=Duncaniella freteri TaxID=2530391 RepID=UPI0025582BA0|nr:gliding motility protein GldN [Duncaniella freteri]
MKKILLTAIALLAAICVFAQDASSTASTVVRRKVSERNARSSAPGVTQRMQSHIDNSLSSSDDSELQWMRVMYRSLDLTKDANGALYYPDEAVEGQDNLFRIIMKRMADGQLSAYEYLDGRERFTDEYKVKMRDILDRFYILHKEAKGSTEKNPKFSIDESDIPASEVLSYYIIERWEFDRRSNRVSTRVEAVCPVLHRAGDFGAETVKYPMFWVRYDDLRPWIASQYIFTDDDNNLARHSYDDYFRLGLYDGDIYKTRNLKNKSLMQLHPDPDDLARARDSIQNRLDSYEKKLWVPSLDELAARREAADKAAAIAAGTDDGSEGISADSGDSDKRSARVSRSKRGVKSAASKSKPAKVKKPKAVKSRSTATRSVRNNRKRN